MQLKTNVKREYAYMVKAALGLVVYILCLVGGTIALAYYSPSAEELPFQGHSVRKSNVGMLESVGVLQQLADVGQVYSEPEISLPPPVKVKGIYLSSWIVSHSRSFTERINLVNTTPLNTMVIDIKDATGYTTYNISEETLASQWGLVERRIRDMEAILDILNENDIYPIARIVVNKDPMLAQVRPEWFLKRADGSIWRDRGGRPWLDPYNSEWWDFVLEICADAAQKGFKEIQFDYIRFPTDGPTRQIVYSQPNTVENRSQAIVDFLAYARDYLRPYGVYVSADIFGLVTSTKDDMGIGQRLEDVALHVDYIKPMVYPSHYGPGVYGYPNPNEHPYGVVLKALQDAKKRLDDMEVETAGVRAWLQDFSLGVRYGKKEVLDQIRAVTDAGYEEWILWDPQCRYNRDALSALQQIMMEQ